MSAVSLRLTLSSSDREINVLTHHAPVRLKRAGRDGAGCALLGRDPHGHHVRRADGPLQRTARARAVCDRLPQRPRRPHGQVGAGPHGQVGAGPLAVPGRGCHSMQHLSAPSGVTEVDVHRSIAVHSAALCAGMHSLAQMLGLVEAVRRSTCAALMHRPTPIIWFRWMWRPTLLCQPESARFGLTSVSCSVSKHSSTVLPSCMPVSCCISCQSRGAPLPMFRVSKVYRSPGMNGPCCLVAL